MVFCCLGLQETEKQCWLADFFFSHKMVFSIFLLHSIKVALCKLCTLSSDLVAQVDLCTSHTLIQDEKTYKRWTSYLPMN